MDTFNRFTNALDDYATGMKGICILILCSLAVYQIGTAAPVYVQSTEKPGHVYEAQLVANESPRDNQKRVSLRFREINLVSALQMLAKEVNVGLALQTAYIPNKKVTVDLDDNTVFEALDLLLDGTNLEAVLPPSRDVLVIRKKLEMQKLQLETVSGTVTDAQTSESLPGVNVIVKGTTQGTATNAGGEYNLSVNSLQDTLVFSFIGYQTQEVPINGRTNVNISLSPQAVSGDELVVVGYGTQRSKDIISGISTVNPEQLGMKEQSTPTAVDLLKGRVSGVNIRESTGASGATPNIQVRGISSINAGVGPLVVVDGFPVGNSFPQSLNPDDIESITVLKDAASTAIYGARGSNGVVVIETTSASVGRNKFSYNTYFGVKSVPDNWGPKMMNALEYAQYNIERVKALDEFSNASSPTPIQQIFLDVVNNPEQWSDGGTDWFNEYTREGTETLSQNHNFTYQSGSERLRTAISGGYLKQNGVLPGDDFKRLSLRGNFDATLSDHIDLRVNISGARSVNNRVDSDGLRSDIWGAISTSPLKSPYDENGNLVKFIPADAPGYFSKPNPLFEAQARQNELVNRDLQVNTELDIQLAEGLSYTPRVYGRQLTQETSIFKPTTVGNISLSGPGDLDRGAPPQNNFVTSINTTLENWGVDNLLNYNTSFSGVHNFDVILGHTIQKEESFTKRIDGNVFPSDDFINFNQVTQINASNSSSEWSLIAGFARLKYDYDGKYLAEVNFRREGSSRLGANNKYGNFPSGAIGWRISQENFYPDNFFIDEFLIRGSAGKTGNNAIGNFESLGRLNSTRYVLGNTVQEGKYLASLGNRDLRWETAFQYQAGLTLGMFNNRVNLKVDYYEKTTKNMLFNVNLPRASGFAASRINIGEMVNKGLDLEVSSFANINEVQWSGNFNISFLANEVTKMPEQIDKILTGGRGGMNVTKEGEEVGSLHGFIRLGLFSEETIDDPNLYGWRGRDKILGTNIFKDTNGDGFIDRSDMTVIGDPHPDVTFGFSNQFSYQNISLSFLLTGMLGYEVLQQYHDVDLNTVARYNVSKLELDRWRSPEQPGDGFAPRSEVNTGAREWMDDWLAPGDHLWVKNIRIAYNLPEHVVQSVGVKGLRLYISADNVARIDNYPGFNPEVSSSNDPLSSGRDSYVYPLSRQFTLGANFSF